MKTATPTEWVLDASAVGKLVRQEPESAALRAWLRAAAGARLAGPPLLAYETAGLVQRSFAGTEPAHREEVLRRLLGPVRFDACADHGAFGLCPPLRYYDAVYVRLAMDRNAGLVTYDTVQAQVAQQAGVRVAGPGAKAPLSWLAHPMRVQETLAPEPPSGNPAL